MTTFLHLLTVCAALGDEPRACVSLAVESQALCQVGMQIAYDDLIVEDRWLYISCERTNVITTSIRPKARPIK